MQPVHNLLRRGRLWLGNFLRAIKVAYLRAFGVKIGKNTMISLGAKIDCHRGQVIIGNNCHVTHGCMILSHDGAVRQIVSNDDGNGTVVIEDNVFLGVNSIILRNVTIGENSVVGAGSVVSRNVPPNTVVAGNPAVEIKQISSGNER